MYMKLNGETVYTNQFSVTRHSKSVSVVSGESGMPGIFFSYELSPLMVKYTEKEKYVFVFINRSLVWPQQFTLARMPMRSI